MLNIGLQKLFQLNLFQKIFQFACLDENPRSRPMVQRILANYYEYNFANSSSLRVFFFFFNLFFCFKLIHYYLPKITKMVLTFYLFY